MNPTASALFIDSISEKIFERYEKSNQYVKEKKTKIEIIKHNNFLNSVLTLF
jgi:hypothetical protein